MSRVALTDSSAWFDTDKAVLFKEDSRWDGRNHISVPTGSQWEHEHLYFTKSGKWVKNEFSNYQGTLETYKQIEESEAIEWLIQNRCFEDIGLRKLPEAIQLSVQAGFAAAEI